MSNFNATINLTIECLTLMQMLTTNRMSNFNANVNLQKDCLTLMLMSIYQQNVQL